MFRRDFIAFIYSISSIACFSMDVEISSHASQKESKEQAEPYQNRGTERVALEGGLKQKLHLVVGSTRRDESRGRLIKALYGNDVDLSHCQTFGGRAITMDLMACAQLGLPHIVGDARTFDFSPFDIQSVMLEKLATMDFSNDQQNYIGSIIENIAKHMRKNSVLEMEWLPFTTLSHDSGENLEACIKANPFTAFYNREAIFGAIAILAGQEQVLQNLLEGLREPTLTLVEEIRSLLTFYHERGIGESVEELISTLYFEAIFALAIPKEDDLILLDYDFSEQNFAKLEKALKKARTRNLPPDAQIGQRMTFADEAGDTYEGFVYSGGYFANTFLNFMLQDLAAKLNQLYVMRYLESLETFKEISIERRRNPYNGRQNVWMIKMTKL